MTRGYSFDGVIVGRLPFEPFTFLQGLTHRNLPGTDMRDCSSHVVFALGMVTARAVLNRWMEVHGWKPKAVQTAGLWEMAEKEANRIAGEK
jgi:hypothetical protein